MLSDSRTLGYLTIHYLLKRLKTILILTFRSIAKTKVDLRGSVNDPGQLMRHFHFAIRRPVELTKAREIYEESLRLIEKHVEQGLHFKPTDIPTNVSYESVLSVTHIQTMMELSGCMNGQFKGRVF